MFDFLAQTIDWGIGMGIGGALVAGTVAISKIVNGRKNAHQEEKVSAITHYLETRESQYREDKQDLWSAVNGLRSDVSDIREVVGRIDERTKREMGE